MSFVMRVFGCLHLHPFRMFANYASGDNSRRLEILDRLQAVVKTQEDQQCNAIGFTGDFFHERLKLDVVSVSRALSIMGDLIVPFVACSGNHCRTYLGESALEVFKEHAWSAGASGSEKIFYIDENFEWIGSGRTIYRVIPIPWLPDYEAQMEIIREAVPRERGVRGILLTHGDIKGWQFGSYTVSEGLDVEEISELYHFAVVGHYHNPPDYNISSSPRNSGKNVLLPGAVIPHQFGDVGGGQIWRLEFHPNGEVQVDKEEFEAPKFVTLDLTQPSELLPPRGLDPKNYYRILVPVGGEYEFKYDTPADVGPVSRHVVQHVGGSQVETSQRLSPQELHSEEDLADAYVEYASGNAQIDENIEASRCGWSLEKLCHLGKALMRDIEQDQLCVEIEGLLEGGE